MVEIKHPGVGVNLMSKCMDWIHLAQDKYQRPRENANEFMGSIKVIN
jgi:hypothetical protein